MKDPENTDGEPNGMSAEQLAAYIDKVRRPIVLETIAEIYATHPDHAMRALSVRAFLKLGVASPYEITAETYDPSSNGSTQPEAYSLNV